MWSYTVAFIAFSRFSSGQDQLKRAFGILRLFEKNSQRDVHAENGLMHRSSFKEKSHPALFSWSHVKHILYGVPVQQY